MLIFNLILIFMFVKIYRVLLIVVFAALLIVLLNNISGVKADSFYPDGNIDNCQFASTIGIQYNSPGQADPTRRVDYNPPDLKGKTGNWIQSNNFNAVATAAYPSPRRYTGVADRVSVPPNTKIDVGFFAWNYTGHTLETGTIYLFTSHGEPAKGDVTRLGAGGTYNAHYFNGGNSVRWGKRLAISRYWSFNSRQHYNGKIFYSFNTIQPIQSISREATPEIDNTTGELSIKYKLTLKNVSTYNVCKIRVLDNLPSGETYDQTICINANATRVLEYQANLGSSFDEIITNSPARIYDNNRYFESTAEAYANQSDIYNMRARSVFVDRNDLYHPNWFSSQPSWGQTGFGLFGVELVPYSFTTDSTAVSLDNDLSLEKLVSDGDEDLVKQNTTQPGEEIEYTVRFKNIGPVLRNLTLKDDFDEDFIEIIETNGGIIEGGLIKWSILEIKSGETIEFKVKAKVKSILPPGNHQIKNLVFYDDLEDEVSTEVEASPDLRIEKSVADQEVYTSGDTLNYSISLSNHGNAYDENVTVSDNLSKNLKFLEFSDDFSKGACSYKEDFHLIECAVERINPDENKEFHFKVQVADLLEHQSVVKNIAYVKSDHTEETPSNETEIIVSQGCLSGAITVETDSNVTDLTDRNFMLKIYWDDELKIQREIGFKENSQEFGINFMRLPLNKEISAKLVETFKPNGDFIKPNVLVKDFGKITLDDEICENILNYTFKSEAQDSTEHTDQNKDISDDLNDGLIDMSEDTRLARSGYDFKLIVGFILTCTSGLALVFILLYLYKRYQLQYK